MPKTISTVQISTYALTNSSNPLYITMASGIETNGGTAIYGGSTTTPLPHAASTKST